VSFVYVYFHFKGDLLSGLVSLDKIVALCWEIYSKWTHCFPIKVFRIKIN
jgi:hypothetical protein